MHYSASCGVAGTRCPSWEYPATSSATRSRRLTGPSCTTPCGTCGPVLATFRPSISPGAATSMAGTNCRSTLISSPSVPLRVTPATPKLRRSGTPSNPLTSPGTSRSFSSAPTATPSSVSCRMSSPLTSDPS